MDMKFIIAITEHRVLGTLLAPYFIRKSKDHEFYTTTDRVTIMNLEQYEDVLSEDEKQLVTLIEQYNDQQLVKQFSKKKVGPQDFMSSLSGTVLTDHIRPYIDRRIEKCIDILMYNDIPLYLKKQLNNIYDSDRIIMVPEEVETIFNFIRQDDGIKYFLTIRHNENDISLTGKESIILVNSPLTLILEKKLFNFKDIDGKKLLPFFTKKFVHVSVQTEKKYLDTFVRNSIKSYTVRAEGFEIVDLDIQPKPLLTLETDLSGRMVLILRFRYDEKTSYYANKKSELKVVLKENNGSVFFERLKRDYVFENECVSRLLSLGLINTDSAYFIPLITKGDEDSPRIFRIVNWLNFNSAELEESGFELGQSPGKQKYYIQEMNLDVKVSQEQQDWFDIHAVVKIGEYLLPFVSFRNHILQGTREYVLPNKEIAILPEEWFEKFRDIFTFGKDDGDNIILEKQHFPLLNQHIEGINKGYKNKLQKWLNEKQDVPIEIPEEVTAVLRHYQETGYSWMYQLYDNGFGGCLADDMGLGKTVQTLTLLQKVINLQKEKSYGQSKPLYQQQLTIFDSPGTDIFGPGMPSLVIVPTSLVFNWLNEIHKFTPQLVASAYVGVNRKNLSELYNKADIIVTSYGIIRNDIDDFMKLNFLYVILDESQTIKNPGSKTYQSIMQLKPANRLVLTGTPIENSLTDLWAQLNFLNPGLLGNLTFFRNEFVIPIEKNRDQMKVQKLKTLINPFLLRRTKSEVAKELPELSEQLITCEMSEIQQSYYVKEKSRARNAILDNINKFGIEKSSILILQTLNRLRQIANHPVLVDNDYMADSGKFREIIRNLDNLYAEGHKTLIFSSFVKHLNLFANYFNEKNIPYTMLTGETRKRQEVINKFQEDENIKFFLISLKAGGVGLNLTAAEYVFLLDPWWNPAAELQAINRAHRIGQDKHVFVYRYISKESIEEKIIKLQDKKSKLADAFVNSNNPFKSIEKETLLELFE